MLYVNGYSISLDRKEAGSNIDFISHAHSDHTAAAKNNKSVLASEATVDLVRHVYGKSVDSYSHSKHGWVRLLDAGHMLGSKQVLLDDYESGRRIVYTGDYQMQRSRASESIEIENVDEAILDSTYPSPGVIFDERETVERGIQKWAGAMLKQGIVLFGAYAMGKAQELIAILNEVGITPVVSKKINEVNSVYLKQGVKLDYVSAYREEADHNEVVKGNFVGIVENHNLGTLPYLLNNAYNKHVFTAVATGFAKEFKFSTDAQFPLSDHADFWQAVEYIDAASPKKVYTYGKGSVEFCANLRRLGYDSAPFENPNDGAITGKTNLKSTLEYSIKPR
jgi:putative mRNA 3-end processing factor